MPSKRKLWGKGTFVDFEHGLNFCIRQIRSALGEDAKRPRFIETLPRRGYRFIPAVSNHRNGQRGSGNPPASAAAAQLSKIEQAVLSVAVLEFENISGDRNIDWLATGLAETLATGLRKLHSISVVSLDRM